MSKTVIVVGAGASKEFGLPVGTELQEKIAHQTNLNWSSNGFSAYSHNVGFIDLVPQLLNWKTSTDGEMKALAKKAKAISEGVKLASSIDNFLHFRRSDKELVAIGKLAIANCILTAEAESSLSYPTDAVGFASVSKNVTPLAASDTWIGLLTKTLSAGKDFDDFCRVLSSITFVSFNYDRCIERYLFEAARLLYGQNNYDQKKLTASLIILRPYGTLGNLRPENGLNSGFGQHGKADLVLDAARNIRTFTEGMESEVSVKIGDAFTAADTAVFLGYGFIATNDDFLFDQSPFTIRNVLGTVYGIKDERIESISRNLGKKCMRDKFQYNGVEIARNGSPKLRSESCADLIYRFLDVFEKTGT